MTSETAQQVEDHALEIIEQKKRPGDSNAAVQVASDFSVGLLSAYLAAQIADNTPYCGVVSSAAEGASTFALPVFFNILSGMMWIFSIQQLIRYHFGDNHQTWNESAKEELQKIIDGFREKIDDKNLTPPLEAAEYQVYKDLLDEAQAALNNDDIYFAKKNQNYNFIRFVFTGAAFATTLGLYASPYAAIAISIVVLIACVRYGYEMYKIQHGETHLDRAYAKVGDAFREAEGREEYLGLIPSASTQEDQENQEDDRDVLITRSSDPEPQISNAESPNIKELWLKAQNTLQYRSWFPFWSPKASSPLQNRESEEAGLLEQEINGGPL